MRAGLRRKKKTARSQGMDEDYAVVTSVAQRTEPEPDAVYSWRRALCI